MKYRTIAGILLLITMYAWATPAQETKPQEKLLINYPGKAWRLPSIRPGSSWKRGNTSPTVASIWWNNSTTGVVLSVMDTTIDYLQKAFALKRNVISEESMPDPRKVDSFQSFMSNERFRKLVESLYAPN